MHLDSPGSIQKWDKLHSGSLRVLSTVARAGWLKYSQGSKEWWEKVSPEVLFDQKHIDSLQGVTITLDHPLERIVTPETWKDLAVGVSSTEIIKNDSTNTIDCISIIGDQATIEAIESGEYRGISEGYEAPTRIRNDSRDGVTTYDQLSRSANHYAICKNPRAGEIAKLHMDSFAIQTGFDTAYNGQIFDLKPKNDSQKTMATFTHDGTGIELNNDAVPIVKSWLDKLSDQVSNLTTEKNTKNDSLTSELSTIKAEKATLVAENAKLKAELETKNDSVPSTTEAIKARRSLERQAEPWLSKLPNFKTDSFDTLSDRQIKEAVITVAIPELADVKNDSLKDADDVVVDSYFNVALTTNVGNTSVTKNDSSDPLKNLLAGVVHNDNNHNDSLEKAKQEADKASRNMHLKALGQEAA